MMIDIDFKYYLSVFWKRFPIMILIWMLFTVLSVAIAFILPSVYRSQATILVESASITLVDETVQTPAQEQIQKIETLLMTRSNLLEIADRFDLYKPSEGVSPTEIVDQMREATEFRQVTFGGQDRRGKAVDTFEYFKQERNRLLNRLTDLETQIVNLKNENKDSLPERLDFNQSEMSRTQARARQPGALGAGHGRAAIAAAAPVRAADA